MASRRLFDGAQFEIGSLPLVAPDLGVAVDVPVATGSVDALPPSASTGYLALASHASLELSGIAPYVTAGGSVAVSSSGIQVFAGTVSLSSSQAVQVSLAHIGLLSGAPALSFGSAVFPPAVAIATLANQAFPSVGVARIISLGELSFFAITPDARAGASVQAAAAEVLLGVPSPAILARGEIQPSVFVFVGRAFADPPESVPFFVPAAGRLKASANQVPAQSVAATGVSVLPFGTNPDPLVQFSQAHSEQPGFSVLGTGPVASITTPLRASVEFAITQADEVEALTAGQELSFSVQHTHNIEFSLEG